MKHMGESMMALVCREGGALSLEERPVPQLQGDRDAVVKVTLSTICTVGRSSGQYPARCWVTNSWGW